MADANQGIPVTHVQPGPSDVPIGLPPAPHHQHDDELELGDIAPETRVVVSPLALCLADWEA